MRREWTVVVLIAAVLATGCVSNKKYQAALTEADTAKMELEKARQQKSAMEQQIRNEGRLKDARRTLKRR
jgi:hypothetical protein